MLVQAVYFNQKGEKKILTNYFLDDDQKIYRKFKNGKIVEKKPSITKRGYVQHTLFIDQGKRNGTHCLHHRLVCSTYNQEHTGSFEVVDHIDGNKLNNNPSNLRFCSQKVNLANVSPEAKERQRLSASENGKKHKGKIISEATKENMRKTWQSNPNFYTWYDKRRNTFNTKFPKDFNIRQKCFKTREEAIEYRDLMLK